MAQASSSVLTVTVLEANLKVDLSSFLQKMSVYCKISLQTIGLVLDGAEGDGGKVQIER